MERGLADADGVGVWSGAAEWAEGLEMGAGGESAARLSRGAAGCVREAGRQAMTATPRRVARMSVAVRNVRMGDGYASAFRADS